MRCIRFVEGAASIGIIGLVAGVFAVVSVSEDFPEISTVRQEVEQESGHSPKREDETQLYMRAKLANSEKVMEGLVTEDFAMIRSGAEQMKKIAEAAHWPKTIDEVYQHYSVSFRRQCDKLADQAERKDLSAAHYTYLHMTTTCIDCHSYVRQRFKVERTRPGGPVQLIPTYWEGQPKKPAPPQPDDDAKEANELADH